jgi:Protein of unknown function (DUF2934)
MKEKSVVGGASKFAKSTSSAPKVEKASSSAKAATPQSEEAAVTQNLDLHQMISTEAYFRAEQRRFAAGADWQDWFEAEQDINRRHADTRH